MRPIPPGLIAVVAVLLFVGPLATEAQRAAKVATVGVLGPGPGRSPLSDAFEQSLQEFGWVKNQNIRFEWRYSAGRPDALAPLAAELAGLGVDVLVVWTGAGAVAAKRATNHVPIVFLGAGDPVRFGLVSSLARPGGNVTGVSFDASPEIDAKKLAFLKEVVPGLARVALLVPSDTPRRVYTGAIIAAAKQALNLEVREIEVREPADMAAAVRKAKEEGAQALSVWANSHLVWGQQLSELAIAQRLAFDPLVQRERNGRRVALLRAESHGHSAPRGSVRRQNLEGRKASRSPGRAAHEVRARH